MKVAFTHNLRLTDVRHSEKEAEFDSVETVNAIAAALEAAGHEVEKVEVSGPASTLLERLEAIDPDIIFNTAEGQQGKLREALYPALPCSRSSASRTPGPTRTRTRSRSTNG